MSLKDEFKDKDYRRAYADSFANTIIATQIRLLRGSMSQKEFAELVGVKQSRISAMEDENYSSWSTKTLKKLAGAKDVVFLGRFVSFGELLNWTTRLSEDALRVPSFSVDPAFSGSSHFTGMTQTTHATFNLIQTQLHAQSSVSVGQYELPLQPVLTIVSTRKAVAA